jgi:hypothetical protein
MKKLSIPVSALLLLGALMSGSAHANASSGLKPANQPAPAVRTQPREEIKPKAKRGVHRVRHAKRRPLRRSARVS